MSILSMFCFRNSNPPIVALSRAKEGLYILGNKAQFSARSPMWKGVIDELEEKGCVGEALPVACHRHPESIHHISQPGALPLLAPDGKQHHPFHCVYAQQTVQRRRVPTSMRCQIEVRSCLPIQGSPLHVLAQREENLTIWSNQCHPDDPNHVGVQCMQRCSRMCPRRHPCRRECSLDCGLCMHIIPNVSLPCGHTARVLW